MNLGSKSDKLIKFKNSVIVCGFGLPLVVDAVVVVVVVGGAVVVLNSSCLHWSIDSWSKEFVELRMFITNFFDLSSSGLKNGHF